MRSEAADEQHGGFDRDLLISCLVLGEPIAVIVAFELAQELEQVGLEYGGIKRLRPPANDARTSGTSILCNEAESAPASMH